MKPNLIQKFRSSPGLIGRVLLILAAVISLYLASISLTQTTLLGCDEHSSCFSVLSTRWAYLFGLPASFPAMAIYLIAVLAAGAFEARGQRTWLGTLGEFALMLITVAAIWFLSLQFFVLGNFCAWCCLTHIFALSGVFFLMGSRGLQPSLDDTEEDWAEAPVLRHSGLFMAVRALAVAGGVVALAAGPFINPGRNPVIGTLTEAPEATPLSSPDTLSFAEGSILIKPTELPLLGNKSAHEFALVLTDYTCDYCRLYYTTLSDLVHKRGENFAVVLLPAARDDNAALVQQTMLCLFRADPEKHATLAAQLIAGTHPALGEAVRLSARGLLGETAWAQAERLYAPWAAQQIRLAREIRTLNEKALASARLPQLVVGKHVLLGYTDKVSEVNQFVETNLHSTALPTTGAAPEIVAPLPVLSLRSAFHD